MGPIEEALRRFREEEAEEYALKESIRLRIESIREKKQLISVVLFFIGWFLGLGLPFILAYYFNYYPVWIVQYMPYIASAFVGIGLLGMIAYSEPKRY